MSSRSFPSRMICGNWSGDTRSCKSRPVTLRARLLGLVIAASFGALVDFAAGLVLR